MNSQRNFSIHGLLVLCLLVFSHTYLGCEQIEKENILQSNGYVIDTSGTNKIDKETLELLGPMAKDAIHPFELKTMLSLESSCAYWGITAIGSQMNIQNIKIKSVNILDTQYLNSIKFKSVFDFFNSTFKFIDYYGINTKSKNEFTALFYFLKNQEEIFLLVFCSKESTIKEDFLLFDQDAKYEILKDFLNSQDFEIHQVIRKYEL